VHVALSFIVLVENVLGRENQGIYVLFSGLDIERALGASAPVG
jgi:alkylation response protein AidB-like acyl-CoA dehydrogenase